MAKKIILPNGCYMGTPSVTPKNWKTGGSTLLNKDWQIQYYFYPANNGKRKLVAIKGMNSLKDLKDRRIVTKGLIEDEIENNKIGYNPIEKRFVQDDHQDEELHPYLYFITAFRIVITKIKCTEKHRKEMGWCVNRLEKKVVKLGLKNVTIEQLKRRQLKQLLESCELPDQYFNKFRSFLSSIFNELIEYECCDYNIVRDIRKRTIVEKQREILSLEHHKIIMDHLQKNHYEFWRYANIFLFSGARSTELFRIQAKDVKIKSQEYKVTILKGSNPKEATKVIFKEVIPLWKEVLLGAKPNDYLFSKWLKSGKTPINSSQITKRWSRLVKKTESIVDENGKVIKVTADFYSLKHSFLDSLPEAVAMEIASHTNSKTTAIYRVNSEKRAREKLKGLDIGSTLFG